MKPAAPVSMNPSHGRISAYLTFAGTLGTSPAARSFVLGKTEMATMIAETLNPIARTVAVLSTTLNLPQITSDAERQMATMVHILISPGNIMTNAVADDAAIP